MKGMKQLLFIIGLILSSTNLSAQDSEFALPSIISDHAVMQRNSEVKLWGWCPGIWDLKIVCSWAPTDTVHVSSDKNCVWETYIRTPEIAGPHSICFYGWKNKLVKEVKDILMGETWICSGQSNMEYCLNYGVSDAGDMTKALENKQVRFFKIAKSCSKYPVERFEGKWEICSPETSMDFSAVGFFFGQRLSEVLNVPVGLIGSYWGGTSIEPWIAESTYKLENTLFEKTKKKVPDWAPTANSSIYNAMIYPITNYTIAGVIWYQGEANNERAADYGDLFNGMIRGWRNAFHLFLPFYYVQIAPYNGYADRNAAFLREQQANVLSTLANTGMVVISDLVNDVSELHPNKKKGVGVRLANMALKNTYHRENLQPYFPMFKEAKIKGSKVIVSTTALGKLSSHGEVIRNFEIVDKKGKIYPAKAKIMQDGNLNISADRVKDPVAVRYCFTNDAVPNLFDINGLPLAPFRTDIK